MPSTLQVAAFWRASTQARVHTGSVRPLQGPCPRTHMWCQCHRRSHATSILWGLSIRLKTRYPQCLATKWATPTIIGQTHLAWLSKSSRKVSNLSSGIKPTVQWPNAKSCKSSSALSRRNDHHGPAATNWLLTDLSQNVALPTVRNVIGVNEALMGVNMF